MDVNAHVQSRIFMPFCHSVTHRAGKLMTPLLLSLINTLGLVELFLHDYINKLTQRMTYLCFVRDLITKDLA